MASNQATYAFGGTVATIDGTANKYLNQDGQTVKATYTSVHGYARALVGGEVMLAARGSGAFVDQMEFARNDAMIGLTRQLCPALYRDGNGWIGRIGSISSSTITLKSAGEAKNFEVGMAIAFSSSSTGAVHTVSTVADILTVSAVNRSANTITCTAAISTVSSAAADDYIFPLGNAYNNSAKNQISGLLAHIPDTTANLSSSFFGVDQTVDPERLAGCRVDVSSSGSSLEDSLIDLSVAVAENDGRPDYLFCSYSTWANLAKSLQGSRSFIDGIAGGTVSFETLGLQLPTGPVKIIADVNCPSTHAFLLEMDSWKLASRGPVPQLLDADGILQRVAAVDAYEIRIGWYGQLTCNAPGHNGVLKLA
jgi:hypothetical protein